MTLIYILHAIHIRTARISDKKKRNPKTQTLELTQIAKFHVNLINRKTDIFMINYASLSLNTRRFDFTSHPGKLLNDCCYILFKLYRTFYLRQSVYVDRISSADTRGTNFIVRLHDMTLLYSLLSHYQIHYSIESPIVVLFASLSNFNYRLILAVSRPPSKHAGLLFFHRAKVKIARVLIGQKVLLYAITCRCDIIL